jgi:hypothetical protein
MLVDDNNSLGSVGWSLDVKIEYLRQAGIISISSRNDAKQNDEAE